MSYPNFSLGRLKEEFGLEFLLCPDLFAGALAQPVSSWLQESLRNGIPVATAIATEKAKSEFIVAPILMELRNSMPGKVAFFSGSAFDVWPERELNGTCDFMVTRSAQQLFIEAPVIEIVEAKRDNIFVALPQCVAAMYAAQIFNGRNGHPNQKVYGVVTTGQAWSFLLLDQQQAYFDSTEYAASNPGKILGILRHMIEDGSLPDPWEQTKAGLGMSFQRR